MDLSVVDHDQGFLTHYLQTPGNHKSENRVIKLHETDQICRDGRQQQQQQVCEIVQCLPIMNPSVLCW
jgi:hypothetical protein